MTTSRRISIVGAGSGEFSMGIVRDLCLTPSLWGGTVSLMDIDAGRLDAIHDVARRYVSEIGADLKIEKTLDREASLTGADFVINCAMVGGWEQFQRTEEISRRHGYPQTVFFDTFFQYRLFMDVIHDMERVCPDAWYIQSANPVFEGCTLITRQSKIKTVGLCHGYLGVRNVARVIGLDPEKVDAQAYGVNHNIWLTKFVVDGVDALPRLAEWARDEAEAYWASPECRPSDDMGPKAVDLYRRLGLFPIGDTATPGGDSYHRWYHYDRATEQLWHEDPAGWYDDHIAWVNKSVNAFKALAADPTQKATSLYPPERTHETNVSIIDALANNHGGLFQVNIPNRGCIPGIADDVAVEVPAWVSSAGIQGLHMAPLPKRITLALHERILSMERDLEAFVSRDRNMLLDYVLSYPTTRTVEQARALLDDVFADPIYHDLAQYFQ